MARHTGGWVKLWRRAALGDINSNFTRGGLFGALIAMANIQSSKVSWQGKPRDLERGEIVTSMAELAELGEVDRSTILRHLNYLALRGTLTIEKSNKGILVKIINYEQYQGVDSEGPHQAQSQAQHQAHINPTHNEERKNKRNKIPDWQQKAFDLLVAKYRECYPGTDLGRGALKRFCAHAETPEAAAEVVGSVTHYRNYLKSLNWDRSPKTSIATYLGTKDEPFWAGYRTAVAANAGDSFSGVAL